MHIFEVVVPGTWLDSPDQRWSREVHDLLRHLQTSFFEANAALNLFIELRANAPERPTPETCRADGERRAEIRRLIEGERGLALEPEAWEELNFETEVRFKREQWNRGR